MSKNSDEANNSEKIEIFSTDDEKINLVGEIFSNESSRTILQLLLDEELTANEISKKLLISLQLVTYHIKKMQKLGFVKISKVATNSKGHDMKYYTATKISIVIVPSSVSKKAKESKLLVRSFNSIYRFAGIGIAGIITWFVTSPTRVSSIENTPNVDMKIPSASPSSSASYTGPLSTSPPEQEEFLGEVIDATQSTTSTTTGDGFGDLVLPVMVTGSVIAIGIFIEVLLRIRCRQKIRAGLQA